MPPYSLNPVCPNVFRKIEDQIFNFLMFVSFHSDKNGQCGIFPRSCSLQEAKDGIIER